MKKIASFGFVILIAFFCVSASVWEGAASVSLNGELPEEGYYVATRSFPRNTIVDVTNMETSQTIRVIVASELDSPGLLAILSKDAAGAIGLHARFVGRIRMTMPSEPIGFSRFTEELDASGDPDFDPAAAIASARDSGFNVWQSAEEASDPAESDPASGFYSYKPGFPDSRPPIAPNPAAMDIVDLPGYYEPPQADSKDSPVKSEDAPARTAGTAAAADIYGYTPKPPASPGISGAAQAYPPSPAPAETTPPELILVPAGQRPPESPASPVLPPEAEIPPLRKSGTGAPQFDIIPHEYIIPPVSGRPPAAVSETNPDINPVVPPIEKPALAQAAPGTEPAEKPSLPAAEESAAEAGKLAPAAPEVTIEVTVVEADPLRASKPPAPAQAAPGTEPAEKRPLPAAEKPAPAPPESWVDVKLVETHPRLPGAPPAEKKENALLPVIPALPSAAPPELLPVIPALPPASPVLSPVISALPELSPIIPALPSASAETKKEKAPAPTAAAGKKTTPGFSVPVINKLEKGRHYLQLAAYTAAERVETELRRINTVYPLTIQKSGSAAKPLYRVLIGPVNSGESGALLQRFRASGYRDAFLRKED